LALSPANPKAASYQRYAIFSAATPHPDRCSQTALQPMRQQAQAFPRNLSRDKWDAQLFKTQVVVLAAEPRELTPGGTIGNSILLLWRMGDGDSVMLANAALARIRPAGGFAGVTTCFFNERLTDTALMQINSISTGCCYSLFVNFLVASLRYLPGLCVGRAPRELRQWRRSFHGLGVYRSWPLCGLAYALPWVQLHNRLMAAVHTALR
jgi:hypothetical protein